MTVPFPSTNRNYLLYADALSSVWAWWDMVTDPSYALRMDLDLWEILHRDPKTRQGIDQRLNDVAGREYKLLPGDSSKGAKIKALIMGDMCKKIQHFTEARRRQAQAIFRGTTRQLIMGRREMCVLGNQPAMHWFVPTGLKHMDPRRFVIRPIREPQPDGSIKVRGKLHMSVIPTYQTNDVGKQLWYGRYTPVNNPEWLVSTIYDDEESRLGHGRGIMDALYFYHWAKQIIIREGLQGIERWAQGVVTYMFDPDKHGDAGQDTTTLRDNLLTQLKAMRSRHYFVGHKDEKMEVHTQGQQGGSFVLGWLEYIDRCIIAVATGASLRSAGDVGAAGGFASDAVGQDLMDTAVGFDREVIAEDFQRDLVGHLCTVNQPQFEALGKILEEPTLATAADPEFVIVQKKRLDPVQAMTRFKTAMEIPDFKVKKAEVYEEQHWTQPDEDDEDIFVGQAPGGGMGMLGMPAMPGADPGEMAVAGETGVGEDADEQGPEDQPLFADGIPEDDDGLFASDEDPFMKGMTNTSEMVSGAEKPEEEGLEETNLNPTPAAPGVPQEGSGAASTALDVEATKTDTDTSGPSYGKKADVRPAEGGKAPHTQKSGDGGALEIDGKPTKESDITVDGKKEKKK